MSSCFPVYYFAFALLVSCIVTSCGDPSPVGAGVLDGERLDINFSDDFTITAKTVLPRSQPEVYRRPASNVNQVNLSSRYLGRLNDPVTGEVISEQYFLLERSTSDPELDGATVDSVILSIVYGDDQYGDVAALHDVEVYSVVDPFEGVDTITANTTVDVGSLLGSEAFVPAPEDTVLIIQHGQGTVVELSPQIRIPLDVSIGEAIIADPSIIESDSALQAFLSGLLLRSNTTNSLFSLNLSPGINNSTASPNGVTIYYELNDTTRAQYKLDIATEVGSFIEHDFEAGVVSDWIDDEFIGDSILVAQGLAGVSIELDFDGLDSIQSDVVNYAELTMVVANEDVDGPDADLYPPFDILVGRYSLVDSTRLASTRDFVLALESGDVAGLFGGQIEEVDLNGELVQQVRINVTSHLKEYLGGELESDQLVISLVSKLQQPGRTIIYGPGHSRYPMKLSVTFTDIQ